VFCQTPARMERIPYNGSGLQAQLAPNFVLEIVPREITVSAPILYRYFLTQ